MGYFLNSIHDEYDSAGNYIGNSPQGNEFHGLPPVTEKKGVLACVRCDSTRRREHSCGGTVCANCNCAESQWKYR